MRSTVSPLVLSLLSLLSLQLVVAGCTGQADGGGGAPAVNGGASGAPSATGGSGGGSPGATGGSVGSGGNGSGGSAAGGNGGASSGGTGGKVGTDAGSTGGTAGGSGGAGGAPAGDGGAAAPGRPPKPSPGCGKAGPMTGMRTITTGGRQANFVVNIPADYDANKPIPMGFAFHGYGNGLCTGECAGFRDLKAVTMFPKALAAGWEGGPLQMNIQLFEDLVTLGKNEFCVDENRIFVAGVSSGGQFVEHLACKHGDWLWAVAPVAAYVDRGVDMNCKGTPPQIVIHGVTDRAGNFGQAVAELYAKRNGCAATPPAGLAMARSEMMAAFSARRAEHRCLNWDGCTANPVRYCISSQITYSGLTHGWPRVGGMLINDFLSGLK